MSVYEHPNNLALYLGRVAPFAACTALFLPWGWRKILYALATLPLFATFLLTYSRGAWVGAAVAIVLAISLGLRWPLNWQTSKPTRTFRIWLAAVVVGAAALAVAVTFLFPSLPRPLHQPRQRRQAHRYLDQRPQDGSRPPAVRYRTGPVPQPVPAKEPRRHISLHHPGAGGRS